MTAIVLAVLVVVAWPIAERARLRAREFTLRALRIPESEWPR